MIRVFSLHRRGVCAVIAAAVLWCAAAPLGADENFDDLFDTAPEDIITEEGPEAAEPADPSADLLSRFDEPDTIRIRNTITATGGVGHGWTEFPDPAAPWRNQATTVEFTSGYRFTFDARPDPVLRVFGALSTEIDPTSTENRYTWSGIAIDELFLDYTIGELVFVRAGQHKMTWGNGRIFTPGNLMDKSDDGLAVRISFPTLLSGVSFVGLGHKDFFNGNQPQSARYLAYAGQAGLTAGPVFFTLGSRYQQDEGLRGLATVKTVIRATDLFTDVVVRYRGDDALADDVTVQTVSGFYREWDRLRLYGEHSYDATSGREHDHSLGLAFAVRRIFDTRLSLAGLWEHAFVDNSGTVVPGISWSPWKFVTARLGFPVTYGDDGSRYVQDNEDPADRRLAAIFQLQLSASF